MMLIVVASDLKPHDVVGEGQELWAVQVKHHDNSVTAWWGGVQDDEHKLTYNIDDLIKVIRKGG